MATLPERVRSAFRVLTGTERETIRAIPGELAASDPLAGLLFDDVEVYNPSALVTAKGLDIFKRMRRDDMVKSALAFKKHAILASGWEIVSPDDQPDDWEPTEFIRRRLDEMKRSTDKIFYDMLSALDFGYSVTEQIWELVEDGPDKGRLAIANLKTKEPGSFTFRVDKYGRILDDGVVQSALGGDVNLPRRKFVIYSHQNEFGNVYGESELEAAYRPWFVVDNAYKWLALMLQRFGIPPVFALYNPKSLTAQHVTVLKDMLSNLQASTSGVIPRGSKENFELWAPELAGQVSQVFIPALEFLKTDIARALLMPGMLSVTPDKLGSYARSKVAFDVFLLSVRHVQSIFAQQVINDQIIKPMILVNFGISQAPEFRFAPLVDDLQDTLLGTWRELLRAGAVKIAPEDETHIRSLMGFPQRERTEDDDSPITPREVFSYHLDNGLLTINEWRRSIGLPDVTWGDVRTGNLGALDEDVDGLPDPGNEPDAIAVGKVASVADPDAPEPPEDADPENDGETGGAELAARGFWHFAERELSLAEKRVDLRRLANGMTKREATALRGLSRVYNAAVDETIAELERMGDDPDLEQLMVRSPPNAERLMDRLLSGAYKQANGDMGRELKQGRSANLAVEEPMWIPQAAVKWLRYRAKVVIAGLDADLTKGVRSAVLQSLKIGAPFRETVATIKQTLAPWLADPAKADPAATSAHRLETTVRTVSTDAYNMGRLNNARRPGLSRLVPAMQYSSIIDDNTTEICRHLDGKIFRVDDPDLDLLTPANHHRCRSILLPMTIDIAPDASGYITEAQKARAFELAPANFAKRKP